VIRKLTASAAAAAMCVTGLFAPAAAQAAAPAAPAPAAAKAAPYCNTDAGSVGNISDNGVWLGIVPTGIPQDYPQNPDYALNPLKLSCINPRVIGGFSGLDDGFLTNVSPYGSANVRIPSQVPTKPGTWGYHIGTGWCAKYYISIRAMRSNGIPPSSNARNLPGLYFYGFMYAGPHNVANDGPTVYVEAHPLNTGWC
jgi:hypothetical protein